MSVLPLLNIPLPFGKGGGFAAANPRRTLRINAARIVTPVIGDAL